jgi:putative FmdB family regulatory protein
MPVYEYVCRSCQESFEAYVRAWGEAVSCPGCQGTEVEKQVSRFAFAGPPGAASSPGGGCGCGRGGCGCGH